MCAVLDTHTVCSDLKGAHRSGLESQPQQQHRKAGLWEGPGRGLCSGVTCALIHMGILS